MSEKRRSWHEYFMRIAHEVSTRATCDRKHVGCVLVIEKRIIATGYNGSIPGMPHCDDIGHDMHNDHCVRTVHAEINAIAQAARAGTRTLGSDCYVNTYPCWPCFKSLAGAGVHRIFYDAEYRADERVRSAAAALGIVVVGPKDWYSV
jgi:dCMP deaminase